MKAGLNPPLYPTSTAALQQHICKSDKIFLVIKDSLPEQKYLVSILRHNKVSLWAPPNYVIIIVQAIPNRAWQSVAMYNQQF